MGSERNPNYPCGVVTHKDGVIEAYFAGYDNRPKLGKIALEIKPQANGHGEEIRFLLKRDSPVAIWEQDLGNETFEVRLFLGVHNKNEDGFHLYPILNCGHDERIGDYTEAWSSLRK